MSVSPAADAGWLYTHIKSHLDAIPEDAACLNYWREDGQFVPIAKGGEFWLLVSYRHLDWFAPAVDITAEDYIVGMELLGFRFWTAEKDDGGWTFLMAMPESGLPRSWNRHSFRLMEAFPRSRNVEAVSFIRRRLAEDGRPA